MGAAGRTHVLETAQLFSDEFYPAHLQGFPHCAEARCVVFFFFFSFLYIYILSKIVFENAAGFLQGSSFSQRFAQLSPS